jgi:hypothetical protein
MRKLLLLAGFLIIFVLAFAPVMAQSSTAYVRIAHFAVNVGEVDVYINGDLRSIGRNVEYGTATSWLVVPAGDFEIAITPEGRSLSAAIIEPTTLTLEPGSRTTIAAVGNTQTTGVNAHLIEENYEGLGEFQSRVTVLHAIPEAGAVDLWLDGELFRGRLAFPGSLTLIDGGTNDGITTFDALEGTYDLAVVPNGLEEPLIDLSNTELAAQTFYMVVAALDADGNPTAIVLAQPAN